MFMNYFQWPTSSQVAMSTYFSRCAGRSRVVVIWLSWYLYNNCRVITPRHRCCRLNDVSSLLSHSGAFFVSVITSLGMEQVEIAHFNRLEICFLRRVTRLAFKLFNIRRRNRPYTLDWDELLTNRSTVSSSFSHLILSPLNKRVTLLRSCLVSRQTADI